MNPNDFLPAVILIEIIIMIYVILMIIYPDIAVARHRWYLRQYKKAAKKLISKTRKAFNWMCNDIIKGI